MKNIFIVFFLVCGSVFALDPQLLSLSVDMDSLMLISKDTTCDTLNGHHDTLTNISWKGSIVYSCLDQDGDSMGVFVDLNIGGDTIPVDSVWGITTAFSGDNQRISFRFHTVHKQWTGSTPASIRLIVDDLLLGYKRKPVIIAQPASIMVVAGETASFQVAAVADPLPLFTWKFNGTVISGANSPIFSIPAVQAGDAGRYSAEVSNFYGIETSDTATLSVNTVPVITGQPQSCTVDAGQGAAFSATATGIPAPSYQWRKNGVNIPEAISADYRIASALFSLSGTYTVIASNCAGSVTSSGAVLNVNSAPVIFAHPQSMAGVIIGSNVSLQVTAGGYPDISYQWQKDGADIPGEIASSLIIHSILPADEGNYAVVVSNTLGSVTSNTAFLDVNSLPATVLVDIPGGAFLMGRPGTEDTAHLVTLDSFKIANTDITQDEYRRVMGVNPSLLPGDSIRPVENVTWFDAVLYCNARSKLELKDTVYTYTAVSGTPGNGCTDLAGIAIDYSKSGYRLPTTAEWEYACRAGWSTDFFWGRSYPPLTNADTLEIDNHAVWYHNSVGHTWPVGSKLPNAWGLYDMVGNVWQLLNDWDTPTTSDVQVNPTGPATGTQRVARGGSWSTYDNDAHLRSGNRNGGWAPSDRGYLTGFRIVIR